MSILIDPDCRDGKHHMCGRLAYDTERDQLAPCPCKCHAAITKETPVSENTTPAMTHYRILQSSDYMHGRPGPFQSEDDGDDWVGEFCTNFANYFGLPVTNNPADHPDSIDAGHFHKALRAALAGAYDLGYMHAEDGHENNPYW